MAAASACSRACEALRWVERSAAQSVLASATLLARRTVSYSARQGALAHSVVDGAGVGGVVGAAVGLGDGGVVGPGVGAGTGAPEGSAVGAAVGAADGGVDGEGVGGTDGKLAQHPHLLVPQPSA